MPVKGDIELNGNPYRIDLTSYRGRDIVDFSPRASTPGGSVVHSDLMLYQPLMQTDWRHGFGFPWYSDAMGYMKTVGNVDTRHDGIVSLYTAATSSDTHASNKRGGIVHKGSFYTWGSKGIRRFDGTTWAAVNYLSPEVSGTVGHGSATSASTLTINDFEVPDAGTNTAIIVAVGITSASGETIEGVTYNGISLIEAGTAGTNPIVELWYLLDPPVGTGYQVEVTTSADTKITAIAIPLASVDSVTPLGTVATDTDTSKTSNSLTVDSSINDLILDAIAVSSSVSNSAGDNQTREKTVPITGLTLSASTEAGTTASTSTMSWDWGSTSANFGHVGVAIKPATSTAGVNTLFSNDEYLFAVPTGGRIRRSTYSNTLILQPDEITGKDTYISAAAAGTTHGKEAVLYVGTDASSNQRATLIKFTGLSQIPSGASITSATLKLYVSERSTVVPTINIHRLNRPEWREMRATYNKYDGENTWTTAGALGSGSDYIADAVYSGLKTTTARQFMTISLDATEVASMVTDNYGLVIHSDASGASKYWQFASASNSNDSWRPELIIEYTSAGEWEDAGVNDDARDFAWLHIHNGKIYAGERTTNLVHYATSEDLSDLEGTDADTDVITVGIGDLPVLGAITFASFLYLARADGLWTLGDDNIARKVLDYSTSQSDDNFRGMAVHNGYLVFPIQDTLYQWNGSRVSDITPTRLNDEFPYLTYGRFTNLIESQGYLYCTARTNEDIYTESLLCYDGVGWHKLADLITTGVGTVSMLAYDPIHQYLWYHVDGDTQVTYYIQLQGESKYPYANFPTTGTHELISSRWDMGFRRIIKSSPSVLIEGRNLDTYTSRLDIYYSLDGGEWIPWGQITEDGYTELTLPGGLHTQEYNYIQLKVQFVTTTATSSPILEGITLRFLMRPEVAWGWNINLPVADNLVYGQFQSSKTANQLWADLQTARNSKAPIKFTDIDRSEYFVYITAMTAQAVERNVDSERGGKPSVEKLVNINLVEAR